MLVTAIRDSLVVLSDSSIVPIPHYGDTAYVILYCVRHTEKEKTGGDYAGLTPEGEARAQRLGKIMANVRLDKACSTNYKRTILTAEAVRKEMALPPPAETYPVAFQDDWLAEKLVSGRGKQYLVVGHQNTIPMLLNRIKGDTTFQNIPDDDHSRFYIAATKGFGQTEILELRY